jgi:hypothetical protein
VIYPSHSTFALFGGFFEVRNPLLAYHPEDIAQRDCPHRPFTRKDRYTVGVLGALSREKEPICSKLPRRWPRPGSRKSVLR